MKTMEVKSADANYFIEIGVNNLYEGIFNFLSKNNYNSILVITDSNLEKLYGKDIIRNLSARGYKAFLYTMEPGEKSKNILEVSRIWEYCIQRGIDRSSLIVALGGGVVGDAAGFTASTYMRGIEYIQIPTSLMAMVDSSIGGKTGVNLQGYKNMIGSFYNPKLVIIDIKFLETLPEEEIVSALGEVIKYGVIEDYNFLKYLKTNSVNILRLNLEAFVYIVEFCCSVKAKIVSMDEKEKGVRALLNLGLKPLGPAPWIFT